MKAIQSVISKSSTNASPLLLLQNHSAQMVISEETHSAWVTGQWLVLKNANSF